MSRKVVATINLHATGDFTGLLISPAKGGVVSGTVASKVSES